MNRYTLQLVQLYYNRYKYSYKIGTILYILHCSLPHEKTYTTYSKIYNIISYHVQYYVFVGTCIVALVQYSYNIGTILYILHCSFTMKKTYTTYSKIYNITSYHIQYYVFVGTCIVALVQYSYNIGTILYILHCSFSMKKPILHIVKYTILLHTMHTIMSLLVHV